MHNVSLYSIWFGLVLIDHVGPLSPPSLIHLFPDSPTSPFGQKDTLKINFLFCFPFYINTLIFTVVSFFFPSNAETISSKQMMMIIDYGEIQDTNVVS